MVKKDKEAFIIVLGICGIALFSILSCLYSDKIPWQLILAGVLIMQFVFILPSLCKKYYEVNQVPASTWRFIPLWNEIQMFEPKFAIVATAETLISFVILLSAFIPVNVIETVLGSKMALTWGYNVLVIFVVAVFITNFTYSFGLCGVLRNLNLMAFEKLNSRTGMFENVYYILLLIPFVRICPLIIMRSKAGMLLEAGIGSKEEVKFVRQEV